MQQNSRCDRYEMINHIISTCSKLLHKDWVGKVFDWELCKKFRFDHMNQCYIHNFPRKYDAQNSLGFWYTNGSPNFGQTTKPNDSKQKKKKESEPTEL